MSLNDFLNSLYRGQKPQGKTPKNGRVVMKKVRFATQDKTKPCSFCKLPAVKKISLGNDSRRLCQTHYNDFKRKSFTYSVKFEKASDLLNEEL